MRRQLLHQFIGVVLFSVVLLVLGRSMGLPAAQSSTIAIACLMIYWWVTATFPLAVTALLPAVLLPLFGVIPMAKAIQPYAGTIIFLFLGGFLLALAVEKWGLHRRVALFLLKRIGVSQRGIIAALMIATGFLSMWISNTATAVIMIPIALSLVEVAGGGRDGGKFGMAAMITIAYAANVGGTATVIGSPPNAILVGLTEQSYGRSISFLQWLLVGLPQAIILLTIAYFLLVYWFFPLREKIGEETVRKIDREWEALGPISNTEWRVIWIFLGMLFFWLTGSLINEWAGRKVLTDPMVAVLGGILLFAVPASRQKAAALLEWEDTERLPWGILLLFGGALSLAAALDQTGSVQLIGDLLGQYTALGPVYITLICIATMMFITELMGGTALTAAFVPVLFVIADRMQMDPIQLALPVTIASNCSFMLPIATPPNAIVFSSGHLQVKDMVRVGWLMNLIAIGVIMLLAFSITKWVVVGI